MRFRFSHKPSPITAFSMASMTDMVLLLLIFFLLTSSFIPQLGIQVNLPQSQTAAPVDGQYVTVAITEDGRFFVDQTEVPQDSLLNALAGVRQDHTALVLRADEKATVGQFALVASHARFLDLRVLLATEQPETP